MKIATILNTHENSRVVHDTLDSVQKWMTEDVLMVVDGAGWKELESVNMPCYKLEGFHHEHNRGPYRNVTLALKEANTLWSDMDWYCYLEYDCLVGSDAFLRELQIAQKMGVWAIGNDHRLGGYQFELLESMLKTEIYGSHYLLGCCVFYSGEFIRKLAEINFFERFLYLTNDFSGGYFPGYEAQGGYDLAEHLYPSLAAHFGGKVSQFASWTTADGAWHGAYQKFPLRFRPDLHPEVENFSEACLMHPLKDYDHPIRKFHREKRKNV